MKLKRTLFCLVMTIMVTMSWMFLFTSSASAQVHKATQLNCSYEQCNYQDPDTSGCASIGQQVPHFANEDRFMTVYWAGSTCQTNWGFVTAYGRNIDDVVIERGKPGIGAYYCNNNPSSASCAIAEAVYCEAWIKNLSPTFCNGPSSEPQNVRDATMVDYANWQTDMLYTLPSQPFRVCAQFTNAPNSTANYQDVCSDYH